MLLIHRLLICLGITDQCLILCHDGFVIHLADLLGGIIGLCTLDGILVGTGACADSVPFEVDITGGNVIQLDDGTTGGGFSASGLTNQAEGLAFFDLEANVINRLHILASHTEVLAKMVYF